MFYILIMIPSKLYANARDLDRDWDWNRIDIPILTISIRSNHVILFMIICRYKFFSQTRPKFSSSVQFSLTDTFKKIEKYQAVVNILPYNAKDQIWTSHVCGFSLSAGSVIRGVIFLMRSLISSHGYKATLWDYQINKIQGWPIKMEHLRMQCGRTKKVF